MGKDIRHKPHKWVKEKPETRLDVVKEVFCKLISDTLKESLAVYDEINTKKDPVNMLFRNWNYF